MAKLPKEMYKWNLSIGDLQINCAVLEWGTRIFSQRSFAEYIGNRWSWKWFKDKREWKKVSPEFISLSVLEPYISDELRNMLFVQYDSNWTLKEWIDASLIPEICDVWIKALNEWLLNEKQVKTALLCQKLISAFAKVWVIALVDEATGYQYDREKDELQKILKAYISEELLPWQKRFPDVFYKELFRLNWWDFTVNWIKKRPSVIGKWTNTLVYNELPNWVLEELQNKTPKNDKWKYKANLHQSLTPDVWEPHLQSQLSEIITLFRLADNMEQMRASFERLRQRKAWRLPLPFVFDNKWHTIEPVEESTLSDFNKKLKQWLSYNPKD